MNDTGYEMSMEYSRPHLIDLDFEISPKGIFYPGDKLVISLSVDAPKPIQSTSAKLRTNLFLGAEIFQDIIDSFDNSTRESAELWRDYEMVLSDSGCVGGTYYQTWKFEVLVPRAGYFWAKPYLELSEHEIQWPKGDNIPIKVHRNIWRRGNSIYCAWPRLMDQGKALPKRIFEDDEEKFQQIEKKGNWIQPNSGTLRDLLGQIDFIIDDLGCRIIQLMPVNPVPFTDTKLGRMGSPYAGKSLVDIDPSITTFDKKSTAIEQFEELTKAIHQKGGKLFIDLVINHTGWGSQLFENYPEFFERRDDGEFVSPGAWGTVWEDLVALNHHQKEQIQMIADAFLIWCERGVDGFRCDAGYQVPLPVWRYITAKVLKQFPDTIFFLEGLGGAVEATTSLMKEGGMQWAYSELFQNESNHQLVEYPKFSESMSQKVGCFVHFSETHDNNRLASRGKVWSVFRNKLCAALTANGAFGFTTGVEWLADEKIKVHNKSGLHWGNKDNLVNLLSQINQTLARHPGFDENSKLELISPKISPVIVWKRHSKKGPTSDVYIFINNNFEESRDVEKDLFDLGNFQKLFDLFSENPTQNVIPKLSKSSSSGSFKIPAGSILVLSQTKTPNHQLSRSQTELHFNDQIVSLVWDLISEFSGKEMVSYQDPSLIIQSFLNRRDEFLEALLHMPKTAWKGEWFKEFESIMARHSYRRVVHWHKSDANRITVLPYNHWLIIHNDHSFKAQIHLEDEEFEKNEKSYYFSSIQLSSMHLNENEHLAIISPSFIEKLGRKVTLELTPDDKAPRDTIFAHFQRYGSKPDIPRPLNGPNLLSEAPESPCVLLTNRRGGMAIMRVDMGAVDSKYDCVLGANLHHNLPVDRHIFVKRLRLWSRIGNRTSSLNKENLKSFQARRDWAKWIFEINDGVSPLAQIKVAAHMLPGENTVMVETHIEENTIIDTENSVSIIARVDIEDRNFHSQSHIDEPYSHYFESNTHLLSGENQGFVFDPREVRQLTVSSSDAKFHKDVEICHNIGHPVEQSRGQEGAGDAFSPGWFYANLSEKDSFKLKLSSETSDPEASDLATIPDAEEKELHTIDLRSDLDAHLRSALRQFVVRREKGWTVVAGYPWFLDWGRDTLIVARGMVTAGMIDELIGILKNFGQYEIQGTLPNTIHGGDLSNRHTSDAPLWFGIVCEDLEEHGIGDIFERHVSDQKRTFLDVLKSIAQHYRDGTPAGIKMDPNSGLIWSPSHYTWMDTNFPAGTPREGYPIEIQIMWHRLVNLMVRFSDNKVEREEWIKLRSKIKDSIINLFWREDLGYLSDLLVAASGTTAKDAIQDSALRSNQVLAVLLGFVGGEKAKRIVNAVRDYLVIPGALRSLAPLPVEQELAIYSNDGYLLNDPKHPYWPRYEGDEDTRRKPAYHNGTAWTWTFPGFCEALAMAYDFEPQAVEAAKAYLLSIQRNMWKGCYGQIPEVLDGHYPHTQRGCQAQAWGVSEALRVWNKLEQIQQT